MTPEQVAQLEKWLHNQAYSATSHHTDQGPCHWLRLDEMIEYLPTAINTILAQPKQ